MKSIRAKLILAFSVVIASTGILTTLGYVIINKLVAYNQVTGEIEKVNALLISAVANSKDFLLYEIKDEVLYKSRKSKELTRCDRTIQLAFNKIDLIKEEHQASDETELNDRLLALELHIQKYQSEFHALVQTQLTKGYKNWGLIGDLREQIHGIEQSNLKYEKSYMLMLRRHEKDYLLRGDLKYLYKFENSVKDFQGHLKELQKQTGEKYAYENLLVGLNSYATGFKRVVEIDKVIGLNQEQGILNILHKEADNLSHAAAPLNEIVVALQENKSYTLLQAFIGVFLLQLILVVFFMFRFSNRLSQRIAAIQQAIGELASGKLADVRKCMEGDELSKVFKSVFKLNLRLNAAIEFAEAIGQGNTDKEYHSKYKDGSLEAALIKMKNDIKKLDDERKTRQYLAETLQKYNQILRGHRNEELTVLDIFLSTLLRDINALQGGVFVLDESKQDKVLALKAWYAFDRKKYLQKEIKPGIGLVGQIFIEGKYEIFNNVPSDYFEISSGLGNTNRGYLLIFPIQDNDRTVGVIEIASLIQPSPFAIELLQKSCEQLGSYVRNEHLKIHSEKLERLTYS